MKKVIVLSLFVIIFITGCTLKSNEYIINLKNAPHNVCGRDVYFSNLANNKEIDMQRIIDTITETCEIERKKDDLEELKSELESIIDDSSSTKYDILYRLQYLIDEYLN